MLEGKCVGGNYKILLTFLTILVKTSPIFLQKRRAPRYKICYLHRNFVPNTGTNFKLPPSLSPNYKEQPFRSSKLENLETNQNDQAAEISTLNQAVESVQASIVDLETNAETLAGTIAETQGQLDALSSSVDQRFNDVNENISKLNSTLDFDETRIDDLEENDQKQAEAIGNIEDNIDSLRLVFKLLQSSRSLNGPSFCEGRE